MEQLFYLYRYIVQVCMIDISLSLLAVYRVRSLIGLDTRALVPGQGQGPCAGLVNGLMVIGGCTVQPNLVIESM